MLKIHLIIPVVLVSFMNFNESNGFLMSIMDGDPEEISKYPYIVMLDVKIHGKNHICGGSIISSLWILTAAHCIKEASAIRVNFALVNRHDKDIVIKAKKWYIHPDYMASSKNDIGLIKLKKSIKFDSKIQPIKLPTISMIKGSLIGKKCLICGYGVYKIECGKKKNSDVLRCSKARIMPRNECKIDKSRKGIMCVHPVEKDKIACSGDSGSGLYCNYDKNKMIVIGVASYVEKNCKGKTMGYESVNWNLKWILKKTEIKIHS